jgi:energy-coupling factor transporter ATP-binding protein EcfA2
MKLSKVQVTNFRSIEDSTEFEVGQLLCLVGKNEAGKTALEQALCGLNPHPATPFAYDIERDYPRRWLTDYKERHPEEGATVVSTKWTISSEEREAITKKIGEGALTDEPVTIYRRYGDTEPQWKLPVDFAKAVKNLIEMGGLDDDEKAPLADADDSLTLTAALTKITEPTTRQKRLLSRVTAFP